MKELWPPEEIRIKWCNIAFIYMLMEMLILISLCMKTCSPDRQGHIYSFGEEGMQLVQPSKFFSDTIFRTRIGTHTCELGLCCYF